MDEMRRNELAEKLRDELADADAAWSSYRNVDYFTWLAIHALDFLERESEL